LLKHCVMKTSIRKRPALLGSVLLLFCLSLVCFVWMRTKQRQYAMNRQLIEALTHDNFKQARLLVESGADPNTRVVPLPTPTLSKLLNQLLHRSPPLMNGSPTALMVVCGFDWEINGKYMSIPENRLQDPQLTQLTQALLVHGANVNARQELRWTALMSASEHGLTDRMTLLREHGAIIDLQNDFGCTALHYAVLASQPKAVKLLLKYHANMHMKDERYRTLLDLAKMHGTPEIIHLIKQAGATE
jgi:ankyrin repeat protein